MNSGRVSMHLVLMISVVWIGGCAGEVAGTDSGVTVEPVKLSLELAAPFADNMILQREMKVPVWGWASTGTEVTVAFAGQKKTAKADGNGRWMVKLDPLEASAEGRDFVVTAKGGESITRTGAMVGEVWFASGQSNMEWVAGKSMSGKLAVQIAKSKEELPIREFYTDRGSSVFPQSRVTSEEGWKSSKKARNFSALCVAFAHKLYEELKVPIGIVRSSHGATTIAPWTPYEGFADHPKFQDVAAHIRQTDPSTPEGKKAYAQYYADLKKWQVEGENRIQRMRETGAMDASIPWIRQDGKYFTRPVTVMSRPKLPGIAEEWKGPSRLYNMRIAPLIPLAVRGAIWCQGTSNGNDGRIYAAKMEALVNGWRKNWGRPDLPFYFTQQQCCGEPDPDVVGFADLREAQRLFFMNAGNVGMVPQHDHNSGGIHNKNKLHPGQRLARWALAHQYGKKIAYTGPIYRSHTIEGNTVRVLFEQRGPGGGLMVGSKGNPADARKDPDAYVEPARETPGEKLKHFRLAGKDGTWHAAGANIDGMAVVVTSKEVPEPVGVQYAYCGAPYGANLYNRAGLPAPAFAYVNGKQLFQEDLKSPEDETESGEEPHPDPYLQVMSLLRDRAVLQRDRPVHVWGFALPGTKVTVTYGERKKEAVVDEFDQWRVTLDPMKVSARGRDLTIACSDGPTKTVSDVVVGDVWILAGQRNLTNEMIIPRKKDITPPPPLPLLREFRQKTKARRFRVPRKRRMEIGGGKYLASWQSDEGDRAITAAAYHFAYGVKKKGVPIGIVTLGADNPPLTWISYAGMQNAAGFEKERKELNLRYPDTDECKAAVAAYIETVKKYNQRIVALKKAGRDIPAALAQSAPVFPRPHYNKWERRTETATHTYNFCISPLTPFGVSGVAWIPGKDNIPEDVARYAPAVEAWAAGLPDTFGQETVRFACAQPTAALVAGIEIPGIRGAVIVKMKEWPKSVKDIAGKLGAAIAKQEGKQP